MKKLKRHIELLAPARDIAVGTAAINHGADAVYIGAKAFGARAAAGNSINDIARLAQYAHRFDARVYATVNTIVFDNELREVELLIHDLYNAGIDALIVQDLALLRLDLPPIALHSSTQCDLRTPQKARFLQDLGFSRLVLARELTLNEISDISRAVDVPLEGFCHGALCVSYSGRCQISQALKHRSANRGECAQLCRTAWNLEDRHGNTLLHNKHLLSLRDFNASAHIAGMIDAGISSFKIEGRLKDENYVKNVVAYYRRLIDSILDNRDDCLAASSGNVSLNFEPQLDKSFNRGFTRYFLTDRRPANGHSMAQLNTPKSLGEKLGTAVACHGNELVINTKKTISNGDGLSYLNPKGEFGGFRVNIARGNRVIAREKLSIATGAIIYRTFDKAFADLLAGDTAKRAIAVDARLDYSHGTLSLSLSDERGIGATHCIDIELDSANTPQGERQRSLLAKLGNTIYRLRDAATLDSIFIPASVLTELRRQAIDELDKCHADSFQRELPRHEIPTAKCPAARLVSADNVANSLAERLLRDHGATIAERALEVTGNVGDNPVMHTRYCLRRELGACLRDPAGAKKLPAKLFLSQAGGTRLEVRCHCDRCEMTLHLVNQRD